MEFALGFLCKCCRFISLLPEDVFFQCDSVNHLLQALTVSLMVWKVRAKERGMSR